MASKKPAMVIAAVMASCAVAAPVIVQHEGWVTKTYKDPVAIPTACAGVTKGVQAGKVYTDAQCEAMTAAAMVEHAMGIAACLPDELPTDTRGAFNSVAYNVGVSAFCKSSIAQAARAGDLGTACYRIRNFYITAGGKKLPGLVIRRANEQALCERGLRK